MNMAEILNKQGYTVEPDNLVLAGEYPVLHRTIKVTTSAAVKRGTALVLGEAGAVTPATGSETAIIGIAADDFEPEQSADHVVVDAYVSGAFNADKVLGVTVTPAVAFGAQANGIYIL